MIDAPIRDYIARLRRRRLASRRPPENATRTGIAGSWSVQLQPGDFTSITCIPQGWLSSAYYVELAEVRRDGSRAGWLKFGEPGVRIDGCAAEHFVEPENGTAGAVPVLFLARHGAIQRRRRRLTAAFDVIPD